MQSFPPKPDPASAGRSRAPAEGGVRALGEYRLLRPLGEGGMSAVYLGYDGANRRPVAVKVLADHLANDRNFVDRFNREARMSRLIDHPKIVRGYAAGRDPQSGKHYLVLEFIDGPTARQLLERSGRLPVPEAIRIALDIARALEYLHERHYVHRDVKPDNILIAPGGIAKLADLGLAKRLDEASELTTLDQGVGTPYYMPYEQTLNAGLVDGRSDLFALGATLYHLLTGKVPFPGEDDQEVIRAKEKGRFLPARKHVPELPEIIDRVLAKMMARDPRQRFASARALVAALEATGLASGKAPTTEKPATAVEAADCLAPTRPDLRAGGAAETPVEPPAAEPVVWLVRFRRKDGPWRTVKATARDVAHWYREGLLPDDALAARQDRREFRPLREYPEFRGLERRTTPRPKLVPRKPRTSVSLPSWSMFVGLGFSLAGALVVFSASAYYCLMCAH